MFIFPYSSALRIAQPPYVTYGITLACLIVFGMQLSFPVTGSLVYDPLSWNPLTMLTSSLAHGGWWHLFGNLAFFMAFAPALEVLIGSQLRFLGIISFIAFVVGICYSVSILIGNSEPLPTLGLSGVVMGMIGLSAYLMPQARIKVFVWVIVFWKTFFIPAWILAAVYIGLDIWEMFTATNYHGINVVAHVAGGIAGYCYGFIWLKDRREETRDELDSEIEAMKIRQKYGDTREKAHRYKIAMDQQQGEKQKTRDFDKFMRGVYQCVKTQRDGEAINRLLEKYDISTPIDELESLYKRIEEWGPSRTLLCFGRLIIHQLDSDKRYGRALVYIEKCQAVSPQFVLADLSKTLFYARFAAETGKPDIAKNMLIDAELRYGDQVNASQGRQILQTVLKDQIDIIL